MAKITRVTSKFLTINGYDVIKGGVVSVITAVLTVVQNSLAAGSFTMNWKTIGIAAASAGVAYLLKNLFQPSQTVTKVQPATTQPDLKIETQGPASKN